jgi:prefoldin subunit 5
MTDTQPDVEALRARFQMIESKRESLIRLLEQPNLGTLRIDVNQALEEIDDLIDEFKRTFPDG